MIGRLQGTLIEKTPPNLVLIDVGGVGYEVETPMSTFCQLPSINESVVLHIQQIVREDALLLYGFYTGDEREAFRLLIKVSGIGPKSAIVILSGLSVGDLYSVIQNEDIAHLIKVPGIGKKTAERLILELRDKIKVLAGSHDRNEASTLPFESSQNSPINDAVLALASLGYKPVDAEKMIKQIATPDQSVDELIRRALQHLMKK